MNLYKDLVPGMLRIRHGEIELLLSVEVFIRPDEPESLRFTWLRIIRESLGVEIDWSWQARCDVTPLPPWWTWIDLPEPT